MATGLPRTATTGGSVTNEVFALARLSAPIVLGLLGGTAFSAIDSYMLSPVGELALASASLTNSILIMSNAAIFGFLSPISILAGRAFGARQSTTMEAVLSVGLGAAFAAGIVTTGTMMALLPAIAYAGQPRDVIDAITLYWLIMALSLIPYSLTMAFKLYLDAIARPWASAFLSIIPVVFVVPLNWLLIYGNWGAPKLGLVGAGAATLLAQTLGVVIMWLYTATSTSPDGSQKRWRIDFRRFVRLGLPMSLQYLAESSAIGVIGLLVGLLGSTALAANQVALSLGELLYMIPLGVAGAVGILIAQAVGENSRERVRAIGLASFGLVAMITLPLAAIMAIYNNSIARAFVEDREVVALLSGLLLTMAGVQVFDGLQTVALGALRGLLDNRWPTVTALISYWLVAVPFSVLLGFGLNLGAAGIWMGFGLGVALASLTLVTRFILQSGRPELPVGSAD